MSKDPLEELFGPSPEEPSPVPARDRAGQDQAVRTAQLPTEKRGEPRQGPGRGQERTRDRGAQAKPWIVVGIIAVLAIVASIVVVNVARGGEGASQQTTAPAPQQSSGTPAQPSTPTTPETPEEEEDEAPGDEVPEVEVGDTLPPLSIPQWGVSAELSSKFGSTQYTLENGNTELWLSSQLIDQLPCEGHWGAVRKSDGTYEVLKPAERCAAAPELYDELWGLTDAFVQSIR